MDAVVSEGGIRHIVPLLTFFDPPTADSKDRRYISTAGSSWNSCAEITWFGGALLQKHDFAMT